MGEVSITWEDPKTLDEPYKTWAEDFIKNYVHRGIRPKYKDFDIIRDLFVKISTIDRELYPKYYNMNIFALEYMLGEFELWINKGEKTEVRKLTPHAQFKAQDLLPKFESYLISGDASSSLKMMDISGVYWAAEYPIGTLLFKNNEEGPGLEFISQLYGIGPKTCNLEGFEAKQIGIGSNLAYNLDEDGKPQIYFLPGTNGQIFNVEKNQIIA